MNPFGLMWATLAGSGLGLLFYGGLYFTLQFALHSIYAAAWIAASFILRMLLTMAGLYWLATDHWQALLAALLGFSVVGLVMKMLLKKPIVRPSLPRRASKSPHGS
jgi:F1F0 ATPase subunit 2